MEHFTVVEPAKSGKAFLKNSSILKGLSEKGFKLLYDQLEWIKIKSGNILFEQGTEGNSLFILISGRLGAIRRDDEGKYHPLGDIAPGESIGEMAVLTGEDRSATVQALRDSLLVSLSSESFFKIVEQNPATLLNMNRVLVERLRSTYSANRKVHIPSKIFVVFSASPNAPTREMSIQLDQELSHWGRTLYLNSANIREICGDVGAIDDSSESEEQFIFWLHEQEQAFDHIILEADENLTAWSQFCIKHGDTQLLVADARQKPKGFILETLSRRRQGRFNRESRLLLIQQDSIQVPKGTAWWRANVRVKDHHHIRLGKRKDCKSLVRFLLGKTISLALAGGGALGMSSIGVIRALQEQNIPIDLGCGASAGATISAGAAYGWSYRKIWEQVKKGLQKNYLPALQFPPIISAMSAHIAIEAIDDMYGDIDVEDLWRKYFSSSSNLTRACVQLHSSGKLTEQIQASSSLPPVFKPYVSESGDLLADGAVLANLPALHINKFTEGKIIAVNVIPTLDMHMCRGLPESKSALWLTFQRFRPINKKVFPTIFDILMRAIFLNGVAEAEVIRQQVDLYVEPHLEQFNIFNMKPFDTIVNIGYHTARPLVQRWIDADEELQRIIDIDML